MASSRKKWTLRVGLALMRQLQIKGTYHGYEIRLADHDGFDHGDVRSRCQCGNARLLTWGGYAPDDVIEMFEAETGHSVEVTTSNNEEMIAKLRATNGGGFDLAQPSQDRITSAQEEFGIYKPIDMSRVDAEQFIPSMLSATADNTTLDGEVYGLPHVWGTSGLVVNTAEAGDVTDYMDLCDEAVAGRVSYRLKRPTLIGLPIRWGSTPLRHMATPTAIRPFWMRSSRP